MVIDEGVVLEIVFAALRSLNEELDADKQLPVTIDTPLYGGVATLDSLSLVSVIVEVEGNVYDVLGHTISLTDDRAMSQTSSPFTNVRALRDYIVALLSEPEFE